MGHVAPHKIADYVAGRIQGRARTRLEDHLEACSRCRTVQLRVQNTIETLRDVAGSSAPASTSLGSARVEAAVRWSTRPIPKYDPGRRWRFALVGGFAVAAAAALLMVKHPWRRAAPAPSAATQVARAEVRPAPVVERLEAVVTLRSGDVRVAGLPLDARNHVTAGATLSTGAGARVGIQWGEGSGALLAPQGTLTLARLEPKAQELTLGRGRVSVRVGPHQPGEALRVNTPDHEVTVHGTWFNVACDARGTTIEVLEGVVEVAAIDGDGSSTRVAAPERAFFPRGRGAAEGTRVLSGREATALRMAGELGLLAWSGAEHVDQTTGLLDVTSTPVGQLAVDGIAFGSTPLTLRRVRGRHLVELSRPGFATISRWVQVGAEPGELRVALLPQPATPPVVPAEQEVQALVKSRQRRVAACYEHSLKRDPSLAGEVKLAIQIGPEGQVLSTHVESDTMPDPYVAECLRHETAGWSFEQARNAKVVYPFVFRAP
jgi:ferric-dicitrate binding protein FerR (iron transport regulator)